MKQNAESPWESFFWKLKIRHTRPTASENDKWPFILCCEHVKTVKNPLGFIAKHELKLTHVCTPEFHLRILVCKNILKNHWKINKHLYLLKTQTCLTSPKNNIFSTNSKLKIGRWIWHENASNPGVRSDPGEGHQTTLISNMPYKPC